MAEPFGTDSLLDPDAKPADEAAAAAHDAWFRSEVEQAIAVADSPDAQWVPHEEVKERFAKKRAELMSRRKAG